ncbi:uncharacterized protein BDR25DRAFT_354476 [Lindgomyces ingoldianus]|uniref:Uncharacterized protein n=1 Tax=Lindgomyces ingoldianus TaxID=673940 RepID=A0ACB6QXI0_9PLEO|nr:uncharacterized protein BDR25DRAFT_354476 [Lindgomyces ingoldianus]KAF2471220.1 hypothetical protein BDR25DRAFT_354476 [Lindgomyces ingoldianus]
MLTPRKQGAPRRERSLRPIQTKLGWLAIRRVRAILAAVSALFSLDPDGANTFPFFGEPLVNDEMFYQFLIEPEHVLARIQPKRAGFQITCSEYLKLLPTVVFQFQGRDNLCWFPKPGNLETSYASSLLDEKRSTFLNSRRSIVLFAILQSMKEEKSLKIGRYLGGIQLKRRLSTTIRRPNYNPSIILNHSSIGASYHISFGSRYVDSSKAEFGFTKGLNARLVADVEACPHHGDGDTMPYLVKLLTWTPVPVPSMPFWPKQLASRVVGMFYEIATMLLRHEFSERIIEAF